MMTQLSGHCLCGAVTWVVDGPVTWACHCHCDSCRRATSSPMTSFLGVPSAGFRWTGRIPSRHASSPGVTRSFCDACGSQMAFEAERYPGEIHLYAASLDDPEGFAPEFHIHYAEKPGWLHINDDLPKYPGTKT